MFEKIINITLKFFGIIQFVCLLLYWFGIYNPNKFGISVDMFLIGLICIMASYSSTKKCD